jgi:VIT1/CCC1 family predicted Fe2+/Mn2+ transporter
LYFEEETVPQIDSGVISLLAGIAAALVQLVKGVLLSDEAKRWLPLGIVGLCGVVGTLLAFYYGRDPVVGVVEGVIAGLTACGVYSAGKAVAPAIVNDQGWIRRE